MKLSAKVKRRGLKEDDIRVDSSYGHDYLEDDRIERLELRKDEPVCCERRAKPGKGGRVVVISRVRVGGHVG